MYYLICLILNIGASTAGRQACKKPGSSDKQGDLGGVVMVVCLMLAVEICGGLYWYHHIEGVNTFETVVGRQIRAYYPSTGDFVIGSTKDNYYVQVKYRDKGWQLNNFNKHETYFVYDGPPVESNSYDYQRLTNTSRWRQVLFLMGHEKYPEEVGSEIFKFYLNRSPKLVKYSG